MPRTPEPYVVTWRNDTKTFQFTLNFAYGLNERVCKEWRRKSSQKLPTELSQYRNPKTAHKRLERAGIKPISYKAQYEPSAVDAIRTTSKGGRPPKKPPKP